MNCVILFLISRERGDIWLLRSWPLANLGLATPQPLFTGMDSNVRLTWPRPLTSSPFPPTHSSSFPHPLHEHKDLVISSLFFSTYPHVLGSEENATQTTNLSLSKPRNITRLREMVVFGRCVHQTPGRMPGGTGCLSAQQPYCYNKTVLAQADVSLKSAERGNVFPKWQAGLYEMLHFQRTGYWNNLYCVVMSYTVHIFCFCQFGLDKTVSLMRYFISFHCRLLQC